jgi:hypothetical protein
MRIPFRSACLASVLLPLVLGSCARVHYRLHEFDTAAIDLSGSGTAEVVLAGEYVVEDSAGLHIERLGAPYRVLVYADSITSQNADRLSLTLIGADSGDTISVELSPLEPLEGDTLRRRVTMADDLAVPYEDYLVVLEIHARGASRSDPPRGVGRLSRRFSHSSAFRLWERLMSV